MFGYVQANLSDLSEEEQIRYHSAYCGLCHTLGERHGFTSRLSLTYDLTFLTLLLSSLYEPTERYGKCRCTVHPCKQHSFMHNEITDYAADMTIALMYHKCLDDWKDQKNLLAKGYASAQAKRYEQVKRVWPEQCSSIEWSLNELSAVEKAQSDNPDVPANCFGKLMEGIFLYRKDRWEEQLRWLGFGLGRYIYLADAAVDMEQDKKSGSYNPLKTLSAQPEDFRTPLMMVLGDASNAFESLPLVQDIHLLRNIMYSGLWIKYNQGIQKVKKVKA